MTIIQMLLGANSIGTPVFDASYYDTSVTGWSSGGAASISFGSDGVLGLLNNGTEDWLSPKVGMDQYEIYVTRTGDATEGSSINTWLGLGSNQYWQLYVETIGIKSCSLGVTVRQIGTTSPTWTSTVTLLVQAYEGDIP